MKKVRFETYEELSEFSEMGNNEEFVCHTPRPFLVTNMEQPIQKKSQYHDMNFSQETVDVIEMFENSNLTPYTPMDKTKIQPSFVTNHFTASDNLELSILDTNDEGPPIKMNQKMARSAISPVLINEKSVIPSPVPHLTPEKSLLVSVENDPVTKQLPADAKEHSFFLKKDCLKSSIINPLNKKIQNGHIGKENNRMHKKTEFMKIQSVENNNIARKKSCLQRPILNGTTCCHYCTVMGQQQHQFFHHVSNPHTHSGMIPPNMLTPHHFHCMQQFSNCHPDVCLIKDQDIKTKKTICPKADQAVLQNAVEKKAWAIKQYEQNKTAESKELTPISSVQENCSNPSVSDLYQIIKIQSEQLKLLQEKVDKFLTITSDNTMAQNVPRIPAEAYTTRQVAVESIQNNKISIGVMTSLEMVRTSTIINKEVFTHNQNAQIQCNKSQISIKEISYKGAGTHNFLDGITKGGDSMQSSKNTVIENENMPCKATDHCDDIVDDKLVNELSLCNINVENPTTPLISPDQTMYLDVKDYSNSESSSDNNSNVGWTYYNKVMTQVNGMLQDSDMPSSASGMLRKARRQCLMQIDKTNISVTKRVKFNSPSNAAPAPAASDTSLRMQQLAAKYLPPTHAHHHPAREYQPAARECQPARDYRQGREYQPPAGEYRQDREYQAPVREYRQDREYQPPAGEYRQIREYQPPVREYRQDREYQPPTGEYRQDKEYQPLVGEHRKDRDYQHPAREYRPAAREPQYGGDMSFATREYMERHQLLNGVPPAPAAASPPPAAPAAAHMPRFLDITALKRQPKLL